MTAKDDGEGLRDLPAGDDIEAATLGEMPVPQAQPVETDTQPPAGAPEVAQAPPDPTRAVGPAEEAERRVRRLSRRSFMWATAAVAGTIGGWRWLITRRDADGIPWPFRLALDVNEELSLDLFSSHRLASTFPPAAADSDPRLNGDIGLGEDFDPSTWMLRVSGLADMTGAVMPPDTAGPGTSAAPAGARDKKSPRDQAGARNGVTREAQPPDETAAEPSPMPVEPGIELTLAHIKTLPRVEMVTELKCIEGWSIIVRWAGARLADLAARYPPATKSGDAYDPARRPDDLPDYVGIETPDRAYYVGLDVQSALHPQTLLCYEMNGGPLPLEHGGPLRLVIPVKYGIKNIKRIGTLRFTNRRPPDYWAEQGYDWYAGH